MGWGLNMETTLAVEGKSSSGEFARVTTRRRSASLTAWGVPISILLLIPCFWQPRLESVDLPSHIYTIWLSELIQQGKAPGLWIAHPWTNVLFDYALGACSSQFGLAAAQRIVVSISVLLFFWSAFALVSALAKKQPWFLVPCLAMLTYGVIFHLGSFNYYLGLEFSFFALALLLRPTPVRLVLAIPLLALAWLGAPLPPLWALGTFAYVKIASRLGTRHRWLLFGFVLVLLFALREVLVHRFVASWTVGQVLYVTGADQVVFGRAYHWIFLLLLGLWIALFIKLVSSEGLASVLQSIPFQLYALCVIGAFLLPTSLLLPQYAVPYGDIPQRFSIIAGILACALFGQLRPSRWQIVAVALVAGVFFVRSYTDDRRMNSLEAKVESLVSGLPPGQRIIGALYYPPDGGQDVGAILDRACIGKCFSFLSYEPATLQFRLRANPGNSIVAWDHELPAADQYRMSRQATPLYEIYRCGDELTALCLKAR
jgi:hypothetical protein